jgi:DNA primase
MRSHKKAQRGQFNRSLLPAPIIVLKQFGIHLGKMNHRGYWQLCCPFHKNGKESNPSLSLHHANGHYRCHTCGAKGGDILAFYMKLTGKHFIDASREIGAWENS